LSDAEKPASAHNALTVIEEDGREIKILRDNMPFGRPGHGEFGTYFIGYSRTPRITEMMLRNMFVGSPPGNYDRILDFSTAVTGSLFFAPSATFLDNIGGDVPPETAPTLKRYLAGRRVVDFPAPGGISRPGVATGHLRSISRAFAKAPAIRSTRFPPMCVTIPMRWRTR
jgi:hypothetical protein